VADSLGDDPGRPLTDIFDGRFTKSALVARPWCLEERLSGPEVSVFAPHRMARTNWCCLPPAPGSQKESVKGDTGPNTGGMGAYALPPCSMPMGLERVRQLVLEPTLRALRAPRHRLSRRPHPMRAELLTLMASR